MEQIPQIVRRRMQEAATPDVHPDPDLLTALAEQSLGESERDQVLGHLAVCTDCREILALSQPEFEPEYAVAAAAAPRRAASWLRGSWLRWAGAAACLVVVGAAVLLRYQSHERLTYSNSRPASPTSLAQEVSPSPPLEHPAPSPFVADKLSQLKQDSKGERAAMDFQAANELAVRQQAEKDLGTPRAQKKAPASRIAGVLGGAMLAVPSAKASRPSVAGASPAAPPFSARVVGGELSKEEVSRDAGQAQAVGESVQVAAAAPQSSPNVELSTDQNAAPKESREIPSSTAALGRGTTNGATVSVEAQSRIGVSKAANFDTPRWTLSADGSVLMRSEDSGKTWQTVQVASGVVFQALSAIGSEVWTGGSGGALYHSSDAGQHWSQVRLVADGHILTGSIVRIDFTDPGHGQLTTANHEVWTTGDGGLSWQKR